MKLTNLLLNCVVVAAVACCCVIGCGMYGVDVSTENGDWPQYRADAGRTGYSPASLDEDLALKWKIECSSPSPAWRGVHTRMTFDHAFQPVIGGTTLYIGSSADCKIYAFDTATGQEQWAFFTDAPVRFAPVLWHDRVIAVSDDGWIYCLAASNGEMVWKKRGSPDDGMVIGNGRLVDRRPVRGGPVIRNDVLYVGAGIWPTDGIYIYALDPATGEDLWVNDESGPMEYDQPHGGARAESGVSSQGYLLAAGDHLFVPTGRSVPAAFDLETGDLSYFHLQKFRTHGGSRAVATDRYLFAVSGNTRFDWETIGQTNAVFSAPDGELLTRDELDSPALAVTPTRIFAIDNTDRKLNAYDRDAFLKETTHTGADGKKTTQRTLHEPSWSIDTRQEEAVAMIVAGNTVVAGFGNGKIMLMDTESKSVRQILDVDGVPHALAAAHGCLYVSTDRGTLYCFDGGAALNPETIVPGRDNAPYGANETFADAAQKIIDETGVTEGWCLDYGCGDGGLAYELAMRTNLSIVAIDGDEKNVAEARRKLDAAGLYGGRVTVLHGDPDTIGLPDYFANLIVSASSVTNGADGAGRDDVERLQRPCGGVIAFGGAGGLDVSVRGPLENAGSWTHLYADPANTINSRDDLVTAPLDMLWFGDSDYEMPSRHGRGVGPLVIDGRMFVQGTHGIRCYDAYNGRVIWDYYIEDLMKAYDQEHLIGAATTHGNWCVEGDRLYVRVSRRMASDTFRNCLVLDTATGTLVDSFRVPALPDGSRGYWGYLAVENGILYGTVVYDDHVTKWGYLESDMSNLFSESKAFFALDALSGDLKWMYTARNSIRHNAIAIGDGTVYLIDRPIYKPDHLFSGGRRSAGKTDKNVRHREGRLLALDARTGEQRASTASNIYGTLLALDTEHDILVMSYQYTRFKLPSEFGGNMAAFRTSDLSRMWDVPTGIGDGSGYAFSSRPIINGDTIYFEPYAFDITTGAKKDFAMSRSYNCGILTGSSHLLLYRSGTIGYLDTDKPETGTKNWGGIRPGCWINTIPAAGLVLMPDATARCNCSYLIKATIALKPVSDSSVY